MFKNHKLWVLAFVILFCLAANCDAADLLIGNFQGTNYGGWTATGSAFQFGPATADWLPILEVENAGDDAVASSEMKVTGQSRSQADQPQGTLTSPFFQLQRKYISFRIGGGDDEHSTCINLLVGGKVVRSATGWRSDRLVPASWDVSAWLGESAQVQLVDAASGDWGHINISRILQTDQPERLPVEVGPLYHEAYRPQFHFTARQWTMARLNPGQRQEGWVNDLNGLIYYDGKYHLFAQRWAKCWLHAVSSDLVHWTELPPAFWEESEGSGVQSGTCVIDYQNTSGLSPDKSNPAMIAFYPRWNNLDQCVAYSLDHGNTWTNYAKNPILVHGERDPKVFWHAPGNHWVMMLYGNGAYQVLTSSNLLDWKDEHHPIKNSFECPDFFQLPVDGDSQQMKWVLIQGNGNYSIGTFDGTEFKEEGERHPCDMGPNFYATQTFANNDTGDGRRIQMAWMRDSNFPEMPFNQQISFPCDMTLHNTPRGLRLFRQPVREIALLHDGLDAWTNRTLKANEVLPLAPAGRSFDIRAQLSIPAGAKVTFNIRGVRVVLTAKTLESGAAPATVADEIKTVQILVDRASIETFVNAGELSSTRFVLPSRNGVSIKAEGGPVTIQSLEVYNIKSAWPETEGSMVIINHGQTH